MQKNWEVIENRPTGLRLHRRFHKRSDAWAVARELKKMGRNASTRSRP